MPTELPWITNNVTPNQRQMCLVIINGRIMPDVLVWDNIERRFYSHTVFDDEVIEVKVGMDEIEGWIGLRNVPLPPWATGREG